MTKECLWKDFEFSLSNPWPQSMDGKGFIQQSSPENCVVEAEPYLGQNHSIPHNFNNQLWWLLGLESKKASEKCAIN